MLVKLIRVVICRNYSDIWSNKDASTYFYHSVKILKICTSGLEAPN